MKKILNAILLISLIVCSSCVDGVNKNDSSGIGDQEKALLLASNEMNNLKNLKLTKQENEEAELAALCLSGEIIAPEGLYNRILNDLSVIRSEYADLFAGKRIGGFNPPWQPGCVMISFNDTAALQVKKGVYTGWDYLNSKFGISTINLGLIDHHGLVIIYSDYRLHPRQMAKYYASLPGVEYAEPNGRCMLLESSGPSGMYPGINGNEASYVFKGGSINTPPESFFGSIYFKMVNNEPELVGIYDFHTGVVPAWWDEAVKNLTLYGTF